MNKLEIIERLKNIAGHAIHTVGEEPFIMSLDDGIAVHEAIELLKKQEPLIDPEQAIDYLHGTGWLQDHDRILTESKIVPPVHTKQTNCEYCHTDRDGYVFPLEKNSHAFIDRDKIVLKANGWRGEAKIKYCPICGRRLTDG